MPVVIAIANQKGGVGKTTTAINLGAGLARCGLRTLLIDLDIQGSATYSLLGELPSGALSVAEVLMNEESLDRCVCATDLTNLRLAPSGEALATVDVHLATVMGRERALTRCLNAQAVRESDVVLIDTAPYLGLLTTNALVAADHLLVPVSCEYLPIVGLKLFNDTLARIRTRLGATCDVLGYLLTQVDRRERITTEVENLLRQRFGELVLTTTIRANTHHKASPSHRKTIFDYEGRNGKGRADYTSLTDEVLARLKLAPPQPTKRKQRVDGQARSTAQA